MFFLALMFVLVLYVVFALTLIVTIRRSCTTWRGKNISTLSLLLAAVLVPTGDHIVGYWVFKQQCAKIGSGLEIVRTVDDVEGFLDATETFTDAVRFIGYSFVEYPANESHAFRLSERDDGTWGRDLRDDVQSQYMYDAKLGEYLGWGIRKTSRIVVDLASASPIARSVTLGYGGGWVARRLGAGNYGRCGTDLNVTDFLTGVLRPLGFQKN